MEFQSFIKERGRCLAGRNFAEFGFQTLPLGTLGIFADLVLREVAIRYLPYGACVYQYSEGM